MIETEIHQNLVAATAENEQNPLVCWADLVGWAYGLTDRDEVDTEGKCGHAPYFNEAVGGCYCGKFRSEQP